HDVEHRLGVDLEERLARLHHVQRGGPLLRRHEDARDGRPEEGLPARAPEPHRRDHRLPEALQGGDPPDRRPDAEPPARADGRARGGDRAHGRGEGPARREGLRPRDGRPAAASRDPALHRGPARGLRPRPAARTRLDDPRRARERRGGRHHCRAADAAGGDRRLRGAGRAAGRGGGDRVANGPATSGPVSFRAEVKRSLNDQQVVKPVNGPRVPMGEAARPGCRSPIRGSERSTSLHRKLWLSTVTVAIALLAVFAGGAVAKTGATGGTLNVDLTTDVDYTDPALDYLSTGWEIEYATCLKLMNYPDANGPKGAQLVP